MNRRIFIILSLLSLLTGCRGAASGLPGEIRFGIVTDVHYADKDPKGTRHYRESLEKLWECVSHMNQEKVDFLIELGDFKDFVEGESEEATLSHLEAVEREFCKFHGPRYHVLGNHDVDNLTKEQFLGAVENTGIPKDRSYYFFDRGQVRFIVLDANYSSGGEPYAQGHFDWTDSNIPPIELEWLDERLLEFKGPAMIFIHQPLDSEGPHYVKNAPAVRAVLEKSKRVIAVFQGHNHDGNLSRIGGIYYYTLKAMVEGSGPENSAFAIVRIHDDYHTQVTGRRRAETAVLTLTRRLGPWP